MPGPITIGERIILHLAQYSKHQNDFDVPFDVSQDGIAEALRISRAHAAIELKKLREAEMVNERISHIRAGPVKRKVYFLTPVGEGKAKGLKDFAERQGIEIMPLLDLKKCRGEDIWDGLSPEARAVLLKASVFRRPFKRSALPGTTVSLLPEDKSGMVDMPVMLKGTVPSLADKSMVKEAHSFAADYWLREGDYSERLYHLIMAGREMEAQMLVINRGSALLKRSDPELYESLKLLHVVGTRYAPGVKRVQGEMALSLGDLVQGMSIADELIEMGLVEDGMLLKGRILLSSGKYQEALSLLLEVRNLGPEDPTIECDLADCYAMLKDERMSIETMENVRKNGLAGKDPDLIETIYYRSGCTYVSLGRFEDAVQFFSKTLGLARPGDKRKVFAKLSLCYEALGMKEKAQEYRKKSNLKRSGSV